MNKEQSIEKYKEYLTGHIGNVGKSLEMLYNLQIPFVVENIDRLREIVKEHDASKYEEPEWSAYLHHFYPTNDTEAMMGEEFEQACRHHVKNNKHHWDYWIDQDNNLIDNIDELEYKLYTIERICDWCAMAAQHDEGPSDYYNANRDYVIQPDYARELCDEIFPQIPEDFSKDMWKITRGELDESFNEDIYLNRDVVDSLGDRVKKSKTSNTIEIDTQMTNHDKQLKEIEVEHPKNFKDIIESEYRNGDEYVIDLKDGWVDPVGNSYIIEKTKKEAYKILKQCVKITNSLNEMKLSDIRQKSKNQDPARIQKSRNVKTTYLGMSKFGILNFKTTSESRNGYHYQTVEFKNMEPFEEVVKSGSNITPQIVKEQLQKQDVNVWCTDESFAYWAWAHQAYKNDFLYIDDRIPNLKKAIQAPKINNVRLNGGACKHILSVIDYCMKPFVLLAISDDMNKYLGGTKEDKMSKQPQETKDRSDGVANWDWEDIENYIGMSRMEILSDISKTIQIIPSIDKADVIMDFVGEELPADQQGLKREVADRIEELVDEEGEEE